MPYYLVVAVKYFHNYVSQQNNQKIVCNFKPFPTLQNTEKIEF